MASNRYVWYDKQGVRQSAVEGYVSSTSNPDVTNINPIPFRGPSNAQSAVQQVPQAPKYYSNTGSMLVSGQSRVDVNPGTGSSLYGALDSIGTQFQSSPELVMMFPSSAARSSNQRDGPSVNQQVQNTQERVNSAGYRHTPRVTKHFY